MDMLDDPSMKEVVDDFCLEALSLFGELEDILDDLEENPNNSQQLEKFGQIIDRVMGAAKSLGADQAGTMCELGKIIGYKSSQVEDANLREITIAVMFDLVDILIQMIKNLQAGKGLTLTEINTDAFVKRLKWLSEKFKAIERSSVAVVADDVAEAADAATAKDAGSMDQGNIDDLLGSLGL